MLTNQAELLATEIGLTDFTASVGWIERWKRRHDIARRTVSGEAAVVDHTVVNSWKEQDLPSLLFDYAEDDIFNEDKTSILYECLPDKWLALKGKKCTGGNKAKERMTVMVTVNVSVKKNCPLW